MGVTAVTSPALDRARSGKDVVFSRLHSGREVVMSRFLDGHEFVTVRVNNLVIRLHLVEARDWSASRFDQVKTNTVPRSCFVQGVHKATSCLLGPQRASYWLSTLQLPVDASKSDVDVGPTDETFIEDSATATLRTMEAESHSATATLRTVQNHKSIAESVAASDVAVRCDADVAQSDVHATKLVTDTVHFDAAADELIAG